MDHVSQPEEILEVVEIEVLRSKNGRCPGPDTTSFAWTGKKSRWIVRR
jgi:hypothetical protein